MKFPSIKLNLTQKVSITVLLLLIVTSVITGFIVSKAIQESYINEQRRSVAQFVQKQAHRHLTSEDFLMENLMSSQSKFDEYRNEVTTPDIVRIKIYDRDGMILSSDQPELVGQKLPKEEQTKIQEILAGKIVAEISDVNEKENIYERQFGKLLEIYVPIVFDDTNTSGIVETYTQLSSLNKEIENSQKVAIASTTTAITLAFIILLVIVHNASETLIKQEKQLELDIKKEKEYSSLKDEFITLASHQLRTPITSVRWAIEIIEKELNKEKLSEENKIILNGAKDNINVLIEMVNNLLIIADLKPDYFTKESKGYSLDGLVKEIISKNDEIIEKKKQKIDLKIGSNNKKVKIKKSALTVVIDGIIKNAVHYSPENELIEIDINSNEKNIELSVSDKGIGIPQEERNKIFNKFFRASNSIEQRNAGSGLSLYIAKKIMQGYQGNILYESLDPGSKFIIQIPNK